MVVNGFFQAAAQSSFDRVDEIALSFSDHYKTVEDLALGLSTSLSTDAEKARVFYMWIANNVGYDCRKFHKPSRPDFKAKSKEELDQLMSEWQLEQLKKTLKSKKGVCVDYSALFKALCDEVELESIVINGYSRNFYSPFRGSQNNTHAWNAVKVDGEWLLLDATWGAGYTDPQVKRFTRRVSDGFFFTSPDIFAQTHLPTEPDWQLLQRPVTEKDFTSQPLVDMAQTKYRIQDCAPHVIRVSGGQKKRIWFQFETTPKELIVTTPKGKPVKFTRTDKDDKVTLTFTTSSSSIVVYGGHSLRSKMDMLAKYKL